MKIAILGSGAVGGYYGARLARAGHDVTFIARGAHLAAIRERGIEIRSAGARRFHRAGPRRGRHREVGPVDLVLVAVKAYDNPTALPLLRPLLGDDTAVLTVQNGVDSPGEVAAVAGEARTLGGTTYIATALEAPGLIVQTGDHRRIVFGEAFGELPRVTDRVTRIHEAFAGADIQSYAGRRRPRADLGEVRVPRRTGRLHGGGAAADRSGLGRSASRRRRSSPAAARSRPSRGPKASRSPRDVVDRIVPYIDAIPGSMRSSLLMDLQQGKRIEVEALQGTVVRRGAALGVPTPIMSTLYSVLKLHAAGETR